MPFWWCQARIEHEQPVSNHLTFAVAFEERHRRSDGIKKGPQRTLFIYFFISLPDGPA